MDYIHLALITLYHVKVTNSRSKSYTLFKLKNYWERRYRCREHTKNVIILRVKDEAYLLICMRLQSFREQVTLPTRASTHNICRKGTDIYKSPLNATSVRINIFFLSFSALGSINRKTWLSSEFLCLVTYQINKIFVCSMRKTKWRPPIFASSLAAKLVRAIFFSTQELKLLLCFSRKCIGLIINKK